MAVITNRGRLIENLNGLSNPSNNDLLVIQDISADETKKITVSNLATSIGSGFTTGSFFTPATNVYTSLGKTRLGLQHVTGSAAIETYYTLGTGKVLNIDVKTFDIQSTDTITVNNGISVTGNISATSFSGDLTGNVDGNLSGSVYGTASWANNVVSSSYSDRSLSSSYTEYCSINATNADSASVATSASYSKTSSYLNRQPTATSDTSLAMWRGDRLNQSSINQLQYPYYLGGANYFDISSSLDQTVRSKQGFRIFAGNYSDFWLVNTSRIGAGKNTHPNMDGNIIDTTNNGQLGIKTFTGSYQMGYATPTVGGAGAGGCRAANAEPGYSGLVPLMQHVRNNIIFFPQPTVYSANRDGAIGIGSATLYNPTGSYNQYLRAKLQIDMFSGSTEGIWANSGNPQVEHRKVAFMVRYASGSAYTNGNYVGNGITCFISSSGKSYFGDQMNIDGNIELTGQVYSTGNMFPSSTDTNTFNTYASSGGSWNVNHGRSSTPTHCRVVLVCQSTDQGYAAGDEVNIDSFSQSGNNSKLAQYANSTQMGVIVPSGAYLVINKTGTSWGGIDETKWKFKIYYG